MELILSDLFSSDTATMTSLDIEIVTGSKHDKVKQSIQRLAARGVIALPPMGIVVNKANNREYKTEVYIFSGNKAKRDSLVAVAQLSPEFTADIVDRWIQLEKDSVSLTKRLERVQRKEAVDKSDGSFHGRGLAHRKKTKRENREEIDYVSSKMQLTLTY